MGIALAPEQYPPSIQARQLGAEPYALPDAGVRIVMSDFSMAAFDIWSRARTNGAPSLRIDGRTHGEPFSLLNPCRATR
jgi:hypothetical protein